MQPMRGRLNGALDRFGVFQFQANIERRLMMIAHGLVERQASSSLVRAKSRLHGSALRQVWRDHEPPVDAAGRKTPPVHPRPSSALQYRVGAIAFDQTQINFVVGDLLHDMSRVLNHQLD